LLFIPIFKFVRTLAWRFWYFPIVSRGLIGVPLQLMTALHVLLLQGKKSAEDTLQTLKLLMDHGV
jgi:hypothetical protein